MDLIFISFPIQPFCTVIVYIFADNYYYFVKMATAKLLASSYMVHEAQGYLRHHYDNIVGQIPQQSLSFCVRNMAV